MLFRYTENPPENRFFAPGFLRLSGLCMGYTENSSFPYTGVKDDLPYFAGFSLACFARIALARSSIIVASLLRPVLRSRAA